MTQLQAEARRRTLYDFIVEYKRTHDGNSPTIREMCAATGITSTSVVGFHLRQLAKAGLIVLEGAPGAAMSRSIRVIGGAWSFTPVLPEHVGVELAPGVVAHISPDIDPRDLNALREMAELVAGQTGANGS